ncbi:MAG TPA: TolC family protein, partial [Alteromonas macleodii]|nr:TolC family protein [Alteromonas macleodii]
MVVRTIIKSLLATVVFASANVSVAATQAEASRQAPSIDALIQSMVNYHPYVLAINEGNYQAAAELEIARSSFDPYIEQKTSSRVSGYYDGTNLTQRFSNPFEDFNGS